MTESFPFLCRCGTVTTAVPPAEGASRHAAPIADHAAPTGWRRTPRTPDSRSPACGRPHGDTPARDLQVSLRADNIRLGLGRVLGEQGGRVSRNAGNLDGQ